MTADYTTYASESTAESSSAPSQTGFTYARALRYTLALAAGLGVGMAGQTWQQTESAADAWARMSAWLSTQVATLGEPTARMPPGPVLESLAAPVVVTTASASTPRPAIPAPSLEASVMVGGERVAINGGRIALPSGTRFQLTVASNTSGILEVHTVNPNGVVSGGPLWSGPVRAGGTLETPGLRLEGARGLETVVLVLRSVGGEKVAQRQVQIWHL